KRTLRGSRTCSGTTVCAPCASPTPSIFRASFGNCGQGTRWNCPLDLHHRVRRTCDRAADVHKEDAENPAARDGHRVGAHEGGTRMRSVEAWKRKMMKNPAFKKEYDALEEEFSLINELLSARSRAKLTQAQVARRMGTSQSAVARIESGRTPSLTSLRKYAK